LGISEDEEETGDEKKENGDEGDEDDEEGDENKEPTVVHEQGNVLKGFYRGATSNSFVITMVTIHNLIIVHTNKNSNYILF